MDLFFLESDGGGYSALHCQYKWNKIKLESEVNKSIFFNLLHFDLANGGNLQKIFNSACYYGAYKLIRSSDWANFSIEYEFVDRIGRTCLMNLVQPLIVARNDRVPLETRQSVVPQV